jgi:hypothetical protein
MAYEPTQARRIAEGLCKDCGAERGTDGTSVLCRTCATKHSARASATKSALRAQWATDEMTCNGCGTALPDTTFKNCEPCRIYARRFHQSYGKPRRASRRGTGVCVNCPRPSTHASDYCRDHWLSNSLAKYGFKRSQYGMMWAKLEAQGFRCYYTGIELVPGINASLDHRIPRSRGGEPLDPENCVWCDRLINAFKNNLTEAEFVERCRSVVARFD